MIWDTLERYVFIQYHIVTIFFYLMRYDILASDHYGGGQHDVQRQDHHGGGQHDILDTLRYCEKFRDLGFRSILDTIFSSLITMGRNSSADKIVI